ncbi:MAG: hypothetical protein DMF97_06390 [Acidobacteria bacterium]|nr:MAG: hypothetical protein DMF97_06390 [Acidobacteriota bacterium]
MGQTPGVKSRGQTQESRGQTQGSDPRLCRRGANRPITRVMNVSPLDLRQQKFSKGLRGFDKTEVTAFLVAAADDYEAALRETDRLRQENVHLEALLNEHRESERSLKSTLIAAQRLADDIKAHAQEEAQRIIRDAEGRSELLLEKTQARLEDLQREIDGLKLKRRDAETSIEATIQTLRNTLDYVRELEGRDRDENVLQRPRIVERVALDNEAHELQRA